MHIKTLTIQGFKSYRDQVAVEPFSAGHNVVVGRNGSGKSNFFLAIRFVLYDAYTSMTREERASLLHEGTGRSTTLSAFVEIVFDNSDGRFPTNQPELHLRRTIGMKKDEYSLDRKSATKAEVMNLLEAAGFSRSNPYYIVPQGRITLLTNMKDAERLDLLKEVAGTQVYEDRRKESLKIMDETAAKKLKIAELLDKIEERLTELEEEKAELKDFQQKDKQRRCLEYTLYQRELDDVEAALEKIEEDRRRDLENGNEKRQEFMEREEEIKKLEADIATARHNLAALEATTSRAQAERRDLARDQEEARLSIEDLESSEADNKTRRKALNTELGEVNRRLKESKKRLQDITPSLEAKAQQERDLRTALDSTNARLVALYAKQGRSDKFKSKQERDAYLRVEIQTAEELLKAQEERVEANTRELAAATESRERLDAEQTAVERELDATRESNKAAIKQRQTLKDKLETMDEQRKALWREDGKLSSTVNNAKQQKQEAERNLSGVMDKDTSNGLATVKRVVAQHNIQGVAGPLYELFTINERYKTAVEATAGNSLFHVVVDNDATVTRILEQMKRENSGRVTFMPLNRLKSHDSRLPVGNDAVPMVDKLEFAREHRPAIEHVFGRTIICPDLATAASYTRSHGCNAITLDGDRVDRKGAMTGGYHDVRRSCLDTIRTLKTWTERYDQDSIRYEQVKTEIADLDQRISVMRGDVDRIESQIKKANDARQPLIDKLVATGLEMQRLKDRSTRLQASQEEAERDVARLTSSVASLQADLASPFTQNLTAGEVDQIAALSAEVEARTTELQEVSKARAELMQQKQMLEIEINDELRRRFGELQRKLDTIGFSESMDSLKTGGELAARKAQLKHIERDIKNLQTTIDNAEAEMDELRQAIAGNTSVLEEKMHAQAENSRTILNAQKRTEKYLGHRTMLHNRKEDCSKNIRDLGVLPEEAYTKYTETNSNKIVKLLHTAQEALKGYAHVNKKAFEQYNDFTKQRDSLLKRRGELETSEGSIQELIRTLDQRKDEAIERTFKQVSLYFAQVFKRLVPAGKGALVMQRRIDDDAMEVDEGERRPSVESYTGVGIRVSFNSEQDERLMIQQLSGGQKALVALATVFAIQKCDPAPFYLFDEIDANLDAQYRQAVSTMIRELSQHAQFITTTFRPEMIDANPDAKCYGVLFDNAKVSSIRTITQDEARQFIEAAA